MRKPNLETSAHVCKNEGPLGCYKVPAQSHVQDPKPPCKTSNMLGPFPLPRVGLHLLLLSARSGFCSSQKLIGLSLDFSSSTSSSLMMNDSLVSITSLKLYILVVYTGIWGLPCFSFMIKLSKTNIPSVSENGFQK